MLNKTYNNISLALKGHKANTTVVLNSNYRNEIANKVDDLIENFSKHQQHIYLFTCIQSLNSMCGL